MRDKLIFEAKKGARLHRYFNGVAISQDRNNMWCPDLHKWGAMTDEDMRQHFIQNYRPCRTLKAFKRILRKSPHLTGRIVLTSKFIGFKVWVDRNTTDNNLGEDDE